MIHSFLIISTDNKIGERGATSLSDALKSNKTLTKLDLECEQKQQHTNGVRRQSTLPFSSNQQGMTLKKQEQHH